MVVVLVALGVDPSTRDFIALHRHGLRTDVSTAWSAANQAQSSGSIEAVSRSADPAVTEPKPADNLTTTSASALPVASGVVSAPPPKKARAHRAKKKSEP